MTLYLASGNPGKLREFRDGAQPFGIDVEIWPGIREIPPCVEDGGSFEANAGKKAVHYSRNAGELVFADDSGLCVDALGGAPGVYSARYAGERATDEANNRKLLDELKALGALRLDRFDGLVDHTAKPSAHYVCVIALAQEGSVLAVFEGKVDGVIQAQPRGEGGFGYDPFFCVPQLSRTFAELRAEDKFAVSHRGVAFRAMVKFLEKTGRLS